MNTKSYTFAQQFARQKASAEKEDVRSFSPAEEMNEST
jgi:hypothetical protein